MEEVLQGLRLDQIVGYSTLALVAILVITRKLIWHTDYEKLQQENNELKSMVFRLLGVGEKLTTQQEVLTKKATDGENQE